MFDLKETLGPKNTFKFGKTFGSEKKVWSEKNLGPQNCWVRKKILSEKHFGSEKHFVSKKILGPKFFLGQITNVDKYCQDISCLDKCHHESWHLLKIGPGTYL